MRPTVALRALPVTLLAAGLLAGCTSSGHPTPNSSGLANACSQGGVEPSIITESCAPTLGPTSDPSNRPVSTAVIPPLTLPAEPGMLASGGNDKVPTLATETFSVTLPAGSRLKIHVTCLGENHIVVKTTPTSDAESEINCGFNGVASDIAVADEKVAKVATHYQVQVTTTPPARWYVVISGTTEPAPPPVG